MGNSLSGFSDSASSVQYEQSELELEKMETDFGDGSKKEMEKEGTEDPEAGKAKNVEEPMEVEVPKARSEAAAGETEGLEVDQEAGMAKNVEEAMEVEVPKARSEAAAGETEGLEVDQEAGMAKNVEEAMEVDKVPKTEKKAIEAASGEDERMDVKQEAGMAVNDDGEELGVAGKAVEEAPKREKKVAEKSVEKPKENGRRLSKEEKGEKTDDERKEKRERKRRSTDEETDEQPSSKKAKKTKMRKVLDFLSCARKKEEGERKREGTPMEEEVPKKVEKTPVKVEKKTLRSRIARKIKGVKDGILGFFGRQEEMESESDVSVMSNITEATRTMGDTRSTGTSATTVAAVPTVPTATSPLNNVNGKERSKKKKPEKPLPKMPRSSDVSGKVKKAPRKDRLVKGKIVESGESGVERKGSVRIRVMADYDASDEEDSETESLETAKAPRKKKKKARVIEIHETVDTESFHENYDDLRRPVWYTPSLEGRMERTQRGLSPTGTDETQRSVEFTQPSDRSHVSDTQPSTSARTTIARSVRKPAGRVNGDDFADIYAWLHDVPYVPIPRDQALMVNHPLMSDATSDSVSTAKSMLSVDNTPSDASMMARNDPIWDVFNDDQPLSYNSDDSLSTCKSLLFVDRTPSDISLVQDPPVDIEEQLEKVADALANVMARPQYTLKPEVLDHVNGLTRSRSSLRSLKKAEDSGDDVTDRLEKVARRIRRIRNDLMGVD